MANQEYAVDLKRAPDGRTVTSRVRTFSIELGSKSGDSSVGFNPAEALLTAAGGCITSSFGLVAANSKVSIDSLEVKVTGVRQDSPPKLISVHFDLFVGSDDADSRIDAVFKIAQKNSTVLSTLKEALELSGEWHRKR